MNEDQVWTITANVGTMDNSLAQVIESTFLLTAFRGHTIRLEDVYHMGSGNNGDKLLTIDLGNSYLISGRVYT